MANQVAGWRVNGCEIDKSKSSFGAFFLNAPKESF